MEEYNEKDMEGMLRMSEEERQKVKDIVIPEVTITQQKKPPFPDMDNIVVTYNFKDIRLEDLWRITNNGLC